MCVAKSISLLKTFLLVTALATVGLSQSQPSIKQREKLLMALKRSQADTNRVNILLDFGQYYLDKPFDLQADIDSASAYMRQAERLSNRLGRKGNKATAYHIRVLLKIGAFYCFKPLELQPDMDSGMLYAKQAERLSLINQPSLWANSLELLGSLYWESHDTLKAKSYFYRAIKQYSLHQDTSRLALIWFAFGEHFPHSKQVLTQKISCYKQSLTYFHQLKNQFREQELIDYICYTYLLQGRNEESFSLMLTILQQYNKENYMLLDYIYYQLSVIEINRGNYQSAMQFNLKAIQQAASTKQTKYLGYYYNQICNIYKHLNDLDKQLEYSQKALYFFIKNNQFFDLHVVAGQICRLLIQKKKHLRPLDFIRKSYISIQQPTITYKYNHLVI